jgi:hypothetical protein
MAEKEKDTRKSLRVAFIALAERCGLRAKNAKLFAAGALVELDKWIEEISKKEFTCSFPADTTAVVDKIAQHLKCDRMIALSKAVGLMEAWVDADKDKRYFVERSRSKKDKKEYEITVRE